ncbi:MAG: diacylglycerol kinase [Gammaproteobacteria bacterium]|nr:diacylglycerol kinase [Gammaproteobacteria bacterium]MDH4314592.1 diacylglycerol kinase [Gammaproteobacteria bacterium]MDH5214856.1 diacylglycerol kinase [Gammaproteobacteria bacterium]
MGKPGNTGIGRIIRAAGYSSQGLAAAWRHEAAFRQEVVLTIVLLPAALWLGQSAIERVLLIGVCVLMLIVELLNSAVEAAIDRHGSEQHHLSGQAKDMGSAAVLFSLFLVALVWGAIAWQRFID